MKRKMPIKKPTIGPEMTPEMQSDPMVMEQINAMRGNPNLRLMGAKKAMRREKSRSGARLSKTG